MPTIEELQREINEIKQRNVRVEADKAWETSWTRRFLILFFTYFVVVIFFLVTGLPHPFVNAIVPTLGFFLSTLTVPWVKKLWIKKPNYKSTKTYLLIVPALILALIIIILSIGSYEAHQQSKRNNFIGIVGGHIYVDNSSGKTFTPRDIQIMWHGFYKGAPGPFLEWGRFFTRRIEILDGGTRTDQECGGFDIRTYTFFNKIYDFKTEANYPCA